MRVHPNSEDESRRKAIGHEYARMPERFALTPELSRLVREPDPSRSRDRGSLESDLWDWGELAA